LLGLYLLLAWPHFSTMARLLMVASALVTLAVLWRQEAPLALVREAASRFAFLAAFMTALALLRVPAYRSALIRRCGRSLLQQPPGRRYPLLSLGATLFGIVLNFGVLNLFVSMIEKANTLGEARGQESLHRVRRRRMLLAALRGFTLAPLISPMGIGVAVVLASLPQLQWQGLLPYMLASASLLFLIGWLLDYLAGPRHGKRHTSAKTASLIPLLQFGLLLSALMAVVFGMAGLFGVRLPQAVLGAVPLGTGVWLAWQCRGLGGGGALPAGVLLVRRLPVLLSGIANEVVALGAGGYLGHLSVSLIDPGIIVEWAGSTASLGSWAPVLAILAVFVLAQLGLNPIVSVTFLASVVAQASLPGVSPEVMAVALLTGWSLTMVSSPFTASMMIMSRFTGMTAAHIGYRWNGPFLCSALAALVVSLRVVSG